MAAVKAEQAAKKVGFSDDTFEADDSTVPLYKILFKN